MNGQRVTVESGRVVHIVESDWLRVTVDVERVVAAGLDKNAVAVFVDELLRVVKTRALARLGKAGEP